MITIRNRNHRPSSFLFDPFFLNGTMAPKTYIKPELKTRIFTNIVKTEDGFSIELAAPGFQKEDFHIDIEDNKLKVSFEQKESNDSIKYTKQEFVTGSFSKSFRLPKHIDLDKITASYELGVLKISLVQAPQITKKIDIQ